MWRRVNVRSGPGINHSVVGSVYRGDRYPIIGGAAGNWINIELKDGRKGWVRSDTVKLIEVKALPEHALEIKPEPKPGPKVKPPPEISPEPKTWKRGTPLKL